MTNEQKLRQIVEAVRKTGAKAPDLTEVESDKLRHIVEAVRAIEPATVSAAAGDQK
jgi:hypothetical protein